MFKYVLISFLILGAKTCNNKAIENNEQENKQEVFSLQFHDIWALEGMLGQTINKDAFPLGVPTLEVFLEENRISGFAGCNNYTAEIKAIDGSAIEFSPIAATKKLCQVGAFSETLYLGLLQKTNNYTIDDVSLNLLKNDSLLLTFKKID